MGNKKYLRNNSFSLRIRLFSSNNNITSFCSFWILSFFRCLQAAAANRFRFEKLHWLENLSPRF